MNYGSGNKSSGSAKAMKPNGGKASTSKPSGKPAQSTLKGYGSAKTSLTAKTPSGKRLPGG